MTARSTPSHLPNCSNWLNWPNWPNWNDTVGIFGGMFDPPHLGHLMVAEDIMHTLGLKRIVFLPTGIPNLKSGSMFSSEVRLRWLKQLIAQSTFSDNFEVSSEEIDFVKSHPNIPNYTSDSLQRLARIYHPAPLAFIMGTDQLTQIHRWHRFPEVLSQCHWIIPKRSGHGEYQNTLTQLLGSNRLRSMDQDHFEILPNHSAFSSTASPTDLKRSSPSSNQNKNRQMIMISTQAPEISSTQIREALALGDLTRNDSTHENRREEMIQNNKLNQEALMPNNSLSKWILPSIIDDMTRLTLTWRSSTAYDKKDSV